MHAITRTRIDLDIVKKVYDLKKNGNSFTKAAALTDLSAQSAKRIFDLIDAAKRGDDLETVYPGYYNNLKRCVLEILRSEQLAKVPDNTAQCLVSIMQLLTAIDEKLGRMCQVWNADK